MLETQSNLNETGGSRVNNIEANAYFIFPEIRAMKNKFRPDVSKKESKNGKIFAHTKIFKKSKIFA